MLRLTFIFFSFLLLISCTHDTPSADPVLEQQPYKKFTDSIKESPANAQLYYHRGSLFYHNNQLVHAEKDMRKAWELESREAFALSLTTILKQKNMDSAITFIRSALTVLPGSIALQVGLARGLQAKGQLGEALHMTNEIIEKYPTQLDALMLRYELLKQQGKNAEALKSLEQAYTYAPADAEIMYELAYEYADQKNRRAIVLADSLIRKDAAASAAKAYYIKAHYYNNTGNYMEAKRFYDASINSNYNFLDAHLDKGIMLYQLKDFPAARSSFERGITISPATADFYYWLAKTQEATGNKKEAKNNYLRAYQLDKSITEAREAADKLKALK